MRATSWTRPLATGRVLALAVLVAAHAAAQEPTPEAPGDAAAEPTEAPAPSPLTAVPDATAPATPGAPATAAQPASEAAPAPAFLPIATPERPRRDAELLRDLTRPLRFGGYFWVDTGYMNRVNAQAGQYDQVALYMQGRFVLGATYAYERNDWFGLARVELMGLVNEFAKSQYEAHALDAYVKAGHTRWFDVQVGRFLAWEVYHRGQGIELFTAEEAGAFGAPTLYWLDLTRGYKNEAGQLAIHVFPHDLVKLEVAGIYGQENNQNNLGVRPVVDFRWQGLQLVGGYEYLLQYPQTEADKVHVTSQGIAAKAQYQVKWFTVGADVAHLWVDAIDIQGLVDSDRTLQKWSFGGFANIDFWRNSIGLGYHRTNQDNAQGEHNTHNQAFVSYLFRLPLDGLSVKAVYGFALADLTDADAHASWTNTMHSIRLRITYEFQ